MTEILILDVGHGNSTVVKCEDGAYIIDAPLGAAVAEVLKQEAIAVVLTAFVSHADADHMGGMIDLLLDEEIQVLEVRCNPDALRRTTIWKDFLVAVRIARNLHGTALRTELTTATSRDYSGAGILIEVLYPPPDIALAGVGGVTPDGGVISANGMSAVLRISDNDLPSVLLAADVDQFALNRMVSDNVDLKADVLVFPHHGGRPGGSLKSSAVEAFALVLAQRVSPTTIVFSFSRDRFLNPLAEIVKGVRAGAPGAHIACTQLSRNCSSSSLGSDSHLVAKYARGRASSSCCAGTLLIDKAGQLAATLDNHRVAILPIGGRLCL